jgi:protein kinase-like protein
VRVPSGEIPARSESGRLPATIGPYRVQREIGRGAAGVVYSVTRDGSEGTYALKLIRDLEGIDEEGLIRFQREAKLSSRLTHPGVVGALDAGAVGRHRYLVLPHVQGESLAQRLRRERALPPEDAATLVARVAEALAAVHAAGVIHRDIKPDNILLDQAQGGAPRLTDFGIAREGHGRGSLTQSSAFLGTPAYMAPEQIEAASQVDGSADVYSLASVLYECLSGLPPFQGATTFQVADQVLHNEPPYLKDVAPDVPRSMAEACHAALAKDPAARPDAATFAKLLHAAVQEEEPPESVGLHKLLLAAALLASLVAVGGWIVFQVTSPEDLHAEQSAAQAETPSPSASAAPEAVVTLATLRERTFAPEPLDPALVAALRGEMEDPEATSAAGLVLADYLFRRCDLSGAEEILAQIPASAPEHRRAALQRTLIMFRVGRDEQASALEADLLLESLEDRVGRLIRARRLLAWQQQREAYELLRPVLSVTPPDPSAIDLALMTGLVEATRAKELLASVASESDPNLLLHLSSLQTADPAAAEATLGRAEALCAPRDCPPALVVRVRTLLRNRAPRAELAGLARRIYDSEPSSLNALLLLIYGQPSEEEQSQLQDGLQRRSPVQYAIFCRSQGPDSPFARPSNELAVPFFPGDASWFWARDRVAQLPTRARRHGFRALTAAIAGTRPWSYVAHELDLAKQADETTAARDLAVEICIRRGRLAEALEHAGSEAAIPPLLRARLEFYRGHEAAALSALREIRGPLARAKAAIAEGQPEEAARHLRNLDESVDVRLAHFAVDFALEQKKDALEGNNLNMHQHGQRAQQGADEVARKPVRENLARVQAQIGCLDMRLGVAFGLLELRNRFRSRNLPPLDHPVDPVHRAVYYAGDGNVPCVHFVRHAVYYAIHQVPMQRRMSLMFWGRMMIPLITGSLENEPAPALNLYLAPLDMMRGEQRVAKAREQDPLVELPEHLLPLIEGRSDRDSFFPEK